MLGPVGAGRGPTTRAHGAPVAALQDGGTARRRQRLRVLVDVSRHVVDAERALALGERAGRYTLPQLVELSNDRVLLAAVRLGIERAPRLVDEARVLVAIIAIRIG